MTARPDAFGSRMTCSLVTKTRPALVSMCRERGIYGYSRLRKIELLRLLSSWSLPTERFTKKTLIERCVSLALDRTGTRKDLIQRLNDTQRLPSELIAHILHFMTEIAMSERDERHLCLSHDIMWWTVHQRTRFLIKKNLFGPRPSVMLLSREAGTISLQEWRTLVSNDYRLVRYAPEWIRRDEGIAVSVLSRKCSGGFYEMIPEPKGDRVILAALKHNIKMIKKVPRHRRTDTMISLVFRRCPSSQSPPLLLDREDLVYIRKRRSVRHLIVSETEKELKKVRERPESHLRFLYGADKHPYSDYATLSLFDNVVEEIREGWGYSKYWFIH